MLVVSLLGTSIDLVPYLFGLGALGVCALNWNLARRNADANGLALMMLGCWAAYNILVSVGSRPDNMRFFAMVDLIVGLSAWLAWRTDRSAWKRLLVWITLAKLGVHAVFWFYYAVLPLVSPSAAIWLSDTSSAGHRKAVRNLYVLGLNVSFALQLATVAWPGGLNGIRVVRDHGSSLLRGFRRRDPMGSG